VSNSYWDSVLFLFSVNVSLTQYFPLVCKNMIYKLMHIQHKIFSEVTKFLVKLEENVSERREAILEDKIFDSRATARTDPNGKKILSTHCSQIKRIPQE
jgi:hypothetical protein